MRRRCFHRLQAPVRNVAYAVKAVAEKQRRRDLIRQRVAASCYKHYSKTQNWRKITMALNIENIIAEIKEATSLSLTTLLKSYRRRI